MILINCVRYLKIIIFSKILKFVGNTFTDNILMKKSIFVLNKILLTNKPKFRKVYFFKFSGYKINFQDLTMANIIRNLITLTIFELLSKKVFGNSKLIRIPEVDQTSKKDVLSNKMLSFTKYNSTSKPTLNDYNIHYEILKKWHQMVCKYEYYSNECYKEIKSVRTHYKNKNYKDFMLSQAVI